MNEETFRLPKSSYEELIKIIQAYGSSGESATLDDVATSGAVEKTTISRNNAFLVSVGIVQGGKAKGITENGLRLSRALQHDIADEVSAWWREIVLSNEFLQKMVTAVGIRGGMEDSALRSHIAYSAGEPKGGFVMAGAGAIVEILKVSRLLKEQDGKLIADRSPIEGLSAVSLRATLREPEKPQNPTVTPIAASAPSTTGISIQIQIQCTPADIEALTPKLRALLKELNRPNNEDSEE